jgi:hypothetical protein
MESKRIICEILVVIYDMRTEGRITEFLKEVQKFIKDPDEVNSSKFNLNVGNSPVAKYGQLVP